MHEMYWDPGKRKEKKALMSISKMISTYLIYEKCINVTWEQLALSH